MAPEVDYESLDHQLSELKAETLLDLIEAMKTSTIKKIGGKRKQWENEGGGSKRSGVNLCSQAFRSVIKDFGNKVNGKEYVKELPIHTQKLDD